MRLQKKIIYYFFKGSRMSIVVVEKRIKNSYKDDDYSEFYWARVDDLNDEIIKTIQKGDGTSSDDVTKQDRQKYHDVKNILFKSEQTISLKERVLLKKGWNFSKNKNFLPVANVEVKITLYVYMG